MNDSLFVHSWSRFLETHLNDWRSLHQQLDAAPDLSPEWYQALLESRNIPHDDIRVFTAHDTAGIAVVLPYHIRTTPFSNLYARVFEPLSNLHCFHNGILSRLSDDRTNEALRTFLMSDKCKWDLIKIGNVSKDSMLSNLFTILHNQSRLPVIQQPGKTPPFLTIDTSWEKYLENKSSSFRYNLRRKRRKLESHGEISIEFITSDDDFDQTYQIICDIEDTSWKREAGTAITSRTFEQQFYKTVLRKFLADGKLLITLLRLSGKAIAYDISAISGNVAYCMKTSFDQAYSSESPGTTLRTELLEKLFDSGILEYDFLGAGESYKLGWSSGVRETAHFTAYNRTARGRLATIRTRLASTLYRQKDQAQPASST